MRQLVQSAKSGEISIEDVPTPSLGASQVLVDVGFSVLSAGTERSLKQFAEKSLRLKAKERPDLKRQVLAKARRDGILATMDSVRNRLASPIAVGYSCSGLVRAVGPDVTSVSVGQRVACGGGGYAVHAEVARVPENLVVPVPETVSLDHAGFATIGAISLHGVRTAEVGLGETVVVIGLGLVGQICVQLLLAAGCKVVGMDLNSQRAELASSLGASGAHTSEVATEAAVMEETSGRGADAVIIAADTPSDGPITLAAKLARDRANVVSIGSVGMNVPRKPYYEKELRLIVSRSYGPGRYDHSYEELGLDYPVGYVRWTERRNMDAVLEALRSGKLNVEPLITHRIPFEEAPRAYEVIGGSEPSLGVLLEYPREAQPAGSSRTEIATPSGGDRSTATRSKDTRLRVGVCGAGLFASATLLPRLAKMDGIELVGISSPSGLSAKHLGQRYSFEYACSSFDELLEDDSINAVFLATPHQFHADQTVMTLAAGKHVYCEKPLATDLEGLERVRTQLEASDSVLQVGFNRRFAPLAKRLVSELAGSGPSAMTYRVNSGRLPKDHWLLDPGEGGGRLIGEGCHFIDFFVYASGSLPHRVTAFSRDTGEGVTPQDFTVVVGMQDGSVGTLVYSTLGGDALPKERFEMSRAGRTCVLDDFRSLEIYGSRRGTVGRLGRQDKGHSAALMSFQQAIAGDTALPITYQEIFASSAATILANASLAQGQVPLTVDFVEY